MPENGPALTRARITRAVLLACAGVSLWLSLGALAVVDVGSARIGMLPPAWWLMGFIAAGAAVGAMWRTPASTLWPLALTLLLWLPWLPLPIPAAFLLWSGPAAVFVWVAALGGVAAAHVPARPPSWLAGWLTEPRRAPLVAFVAGTLCAVAAAGALTRQIPGGDEPHYLIITQSLLLDGDLQIENNHQRRDYLPYVLNLPKPDFLRRGLNRQIYSVHAPGLPALVAPAFALGGYPAVVVLVALLVAAGGALAWHAAWLLTSSAAAAWMGWSAVFFCAPVFFHAFTVYPDGVGAAMAMVAVWLLVRLEMDRTPVASRVLAGAGAALAMLPWLHSRFALVAAGLGLAIVLRLLTVPKRWRALTAFLIVPAVASLAWFGFFKIIYGTFSPAAPYGGVAENRLALLAPGLLGLLVDQQFGLFGSAPVLALALLGGILMARRHWRLVLALALTAVPYIIAVATYPMWWAGHSAPARFLTILLLPAVLSVAWLWHGSQARWARPAIAAASLVGWLLVVLRTTVERGRLLYNVRDGRDLLLDWLSSMVDVPRALPALHRDLVPVALGDALIWTVVLGLVLVVLWWLRRQTAPARGVAWTQTSVLTCVAVMAASTLVWARHDRPMTPRTSRLALLETWDPERRPLAVELPGLTLTTPRDILQYTLIETPVRTLATGADRPLMTLPLLPAGDYEVVARGAGPLAGALGVSVGRSAQLFERIDLTNRPAGDTGLMFRLPVAAQAVAIRGDKAAQAAVSQLMLRPASVRGPAEQVSIGHARRAARYGPVRVFFLDEDPFVETPGFWTAGGTATTVVADVDTGARAAMVIRAGAVPTTVTLSFGAWRIDYALGAGQEQAVDLPWTGTARELSIATSARFRPADVDPKSSDQRHLGVWVEFR